MIDTISPIKLATIKLSSVGDDLGKRVLSHIAGRDI